MRITVKDLGDDTRRLQQLRPGVRVYAEGPYGAFTDARRTRRRVLLVAGGIGVTPLRAMLDGYGLTTTSCCCTASPGPRTRSSSKSCAASREAPNMTIHIIAGTEIGDDRTDLLSIPALRKGVPDIAGRECFVCGPPALIAAMHRRLLKLGVPRGHIHYERFEL